MNELKIRQYESRSFIRKKSDVCVIIPFYNGSKFIERSLKSIYQQSVLPDEIIIVNDGSTSAEKDFVDQLSEQFSFKLIHKKNGGQGSARNQGVRESTSSYICFLDQDDFYTPNHIEDLLSAVPKKDVRFGFVYADLYIADGAGFIQFHGVTKKHGTHPKNNIFELISNDMFILPSASIIRREAFIAVNGFDEQFTGYEDDDLFMRIFRSGFTNYYIDTLVTVWCINIESTSFSIKMSRSRFRYFQKLNKLFPDVYEQNLFYYRDCIEPRFGNSFLYDVIKAIKSDDKHLSENIDTFRNFVWLTWAQKYFPLKRKLKWILYLLILNLPKQPLKALFLLLDFNKMR